VGEKDHFHGVGFGKRSELFGKEPSKFGGGDGIKLESYSYFQGKSGVKGGVQ